MKPLQILQISDLRVGDPDADSEAALDALEVQLNLLGAVDYLLVCGNITRSGTPDQYDRARELIERLAGRLLRRDPSEDERRLNRLLVVPGRNDVNKASRLANFTAFHDRLFAREIERGRVPRFDEGSIVYRDLKDLTMIGALYWSSDDSELNSALLKQMTGAVEQKAGQKRLQYCEGTPTILCSAEAPFQVGIPGERIAALRDAFSPKRLRIGLQLIGSADTTYILPEPTGFQHISISTGQRDGSGFWPFRANLIGVRGGPPARNGNGRTRPALLSTRLLMKRSAGQPFEDYQHLNGELDSLIPLPPSRRRSGNVFTGMMKRIEEKLGAPGLVIVSGLPGAGKSELYKYIVQHKRLDSKRIFQVAAFTVDSPRTYEAEAFTRKLEAQVARVADAPPGTRLLAIYDEVYPSLREAEKERIVDLLRHCQAPIEGKKVDYILYFVPRVGIIHEYNAPRADKVELKPIPEASFSALMRDYSWQVPVRDEDVYRLTGGYVGFSRLLLAAAENHFVKNISGAEPIGPETGADLVWNTLKADSGLADEAHELYKNLRRYAGPSVADFLSEKVVAAAERLRAGRPPECVTFTLDELRRAQGPGIGVEYGLDYLSSSGLVTRDSRGVYRLLVLAPFLAYRPERGTAATVMATPASAGSLREAGRGMAVASAALAVQQWECLRQVLGRSEWARHQERPRLWRQLFPEPFPSVEEADARAPHVPASEFATIVVNALREADNSEPLRRLLEILRQRLPNDHCLEAVTAALSSFHSRP